MRKVKFLVASLLFCAMSYAGYMGYERVTMSEAERFMQANVEALTSGESAYLKGRWRTVGCGSYNFSDWKTYCCPHQYYQNCPSRGNCNSTTIFGCD